METRDIILELRNKAGLSQDELAEKIFVTRQAVSRWENGETTPNTDTLKLLSKLFDVSINTLLGAPRELICQCCGMPLKDDIIGRDADGSPNEDYCKWCYVDGTYMYSNMDDLINVCVGHTYAYDTEGLQTQKTREEAAKERIFSILPEEQAAELIALFDEFEAYETAESKFAHAMDNLQPLILNDSNNGGDWREHNVTVEQIYKRQSKTKLGSEKLFEITDRIIRENVKKGNLK